MGSAMYLRKSRADDANEPVEATIARHKKFLMEYAEKKQIQILAIYEEVVTGDSLFIRPEMLRLLGDMEHGRYASVLVMDIDRLGRGGQKDAGIILEAFKFSGTKIETPDKLYDLDNELDEELAEFKTFMSRRELKIITKRLQRGLRQTIREGGYIANAPYGYIKAEINGKPSLQINELEAGFVRMIFDMYVNQGVGCSLIAETLNSLGAKPHRSGAFCRTSVQHILRNPAMCGKIVWDRTKWIRKGKYGNEHHIRTCQAQEKWIVTQGVHEPLISEELFNRAQEIYHGRYHPPCNDGTVKNPFSGLVFCAKCGKLMQMHRRSSGAPYAYLRCFTKGCSPSSHLEHLETALLLHMEYELARLHVQIQAPAKQACPSLEKALKETERELALAQTQRSNLHDLLEQGVYTAGVFRERSALLEERLALLRKQAAEQAAALKRMAGTSLEKQAARISNALLCYRAAAPGERNAMLKQMISRIVYSKEKGAAQMDFSLTVYWKPLPPFKE